MEKVYILYLSEHPVRSLKVFSSKAKLIYFLKMQKHTNSLMALMKQLEGIKGFNVGDVVSVPKEDGIMLRVEVRWLNELVTYPVGCYS